MHQFVVHIFHRCVVLCNSAYFTGLQANFLHTYIHISFCRHTHSCLQTYAAAKTSSLLTSLQSRNYFPCMSLNILNTRKKFQINIFYVNDPLIMPLLYALCADNMQYQACLFTFLVMIMLFTFSKAVQESLHALSSCSNSLIQSTSKQTKIPLITC